MEKNICVKFVYYIFFLILLKQISGSKKLSLRFRFGLKIDPIDPNKHNAIFIKNLYILPN